jgi:hypothetical protein
MKVSRDEFEAASARAAARLRKTPCAMKARHERKRDRVVVVLNTGIEVAFRPGDARGLERAKPDQLNEIEISPSGLGIHFPKLDADIYLPALLEGFLGSKRWMAAKRGRTGGKAAVVRRNGKAGGRPKGWPVRKGQPSHVRDGPAILGYEGPRISIDQIHGGIAIRKAARRARRRSRKHVRG